MYCFFFFASKLSTEYAFGRKAMNRGLSGGAAGACEKGAIKKGTCEKKAMNKADQSSGEKNERETRPIILSRLLTIKKKTCE